MKKIDVLHDIRDRLEEMMSSYYEKALMNSLFGNAEYLFGKVIGYKKVRVPKYLTIKVPVITKEYDNDSEYGDGSFRGFLLSFEERKLFRIGTTIEKQPIYRKTKGETITFSRYGGLK